jgi:hypothetical protein
MKSGGADRAIERYVELGWLRAIVATVPIAGPALDALVTSAASELARKRIEHFGQSLREVAESLDEKLDKSVVESAEWQDLAIRAFTAAGRTQDEERRRMYAGILLGSATPEWPDDLDSEAVLAALADLSITELRVLRHLNEHPIFAGQPVGSIADADRAWNAAVETLPEGLRTDLVFHAKRIERVGFLSEVTGSFLDYGGGVYVLTPTFVRLIGALKKIS